MIGPALCKCFAMSRAFARTAFSIGSPDCPFVSSIAGEIALNTFGISPFSVAPATAAETAPQCWCPSTTIKCVPKCSTAYSMLPNPTSSTTSPAVRTTKMSPKPTSKTSSGGTRESEQLTTTANGFCSFARAWRRSISAGPVGSFDFPATNRLFSLSNRLSASSAPMLVDSPAMLLAENARQTTKMRIFDINVRRLIAPLISLCHCRGKDKKRQNLSRVKRYWEIIADNLSKAGWSWGCVSVVDSNGQTIWIADAHRGDGKRFVVRADEKLSAFLELEAVIRGGGEFVSTGCRDFSKLGVAKRI